MSTDTNVIADRAVDMVVDVEVDPVAGGGYRRRNLSSPS